MTVVLWLETQLSDLTVETLPLWALEMDRVKLGIQEAFGFVTEESLLLYAKELCLLLALVAVGPLILEYFLMIWDRWIIIQHSYHQRTVKLIFLVLVQQSLDLVALAYIFEVALV